MKAVSIYGILVLAAASMASAAPHTVVVTASNAATNQLLVYDTGGNLLQTINTQGQGGATGNAGGIAANGGELAVVNFGSQNVTIFERQGNGFQYSELVPSASGPLSVAFGHDHLYILGSTTVESHRMYGMDVSAAADGTVGLLLGDGSAAQVGIVGNQLIVTEKDNVIETVGLGGDGAVAGVPALVKNIPSNVNAPFGLVTRDDNAYVTIAHADEISLVRNGAVVSTTPTSAFQGPQQHAPCWVTLDGPYLYSSNSPSKSVSRYVATGQKIIPDENVAATFDGAPTDIDSGDGMVAVIDGNGPVSHLSIFHVGPGGELTLLASATISNPINGVAVVMAAGPGN